MDRNPRKLVVIGTVLIGVMAVTGAVMFAAGQRGRREVTVIGGVAVIPLFPAPVADKYGEVYASDFNVLPDGIDHSIDLQNLINAMAASASGVKGLGASAAKIRFAPGRTVAAGNWDILPTVRLCGAGKGSGGTVLVSSGTTPTVGRNLSGALGTVAVEISDMGIVNSTGDAVHITGIIGGSINRCRFTAPGSGGRGWVSDRIKVGGASPVPNTGLHLTDCNFNRCAATGISAWGRMKLDNTECTGCGIGMDVSGTVDCHLCRFEENGTGLLLGNLSSCNGIFDACTFEANLLHLRATKNTSHCVFNSCIVLGDKNAGTTFPTYGFDIEGSSYCEFHACDLQGTFTQATIYLGANTGPSIFGTTTAGNTNPAIWNVQMPPANLTTLQTVVH